MKRVFNHQWLAVRILLAISLLMLMLPPAGFAADLQDLLLSDCSSGWTYGGNSEIDYAVPGTEGSALQVTGGYGALRALNTTFASKNLSAYAYIEWDMRFTVTDSEQDQLPAILSAYSDGFYLALTDSSDKTYRFTLPQMDITLRGSDRWYHARAPLADANIDLAHVTGIEIATLGSNAFNTDLYANESRTKFRIDSFQATAAPAIEPTVLGAQTNGNDEIRFQAAISKTAYFQLKNQYTQVVTGYLIADASDFEDAPLVIGSSRAYRDYPVDRVYASENDNELLFPLIVSEASLNISRQTKLVARAYVKCADSAGNTEIFYSYDDTCGGYAVTPDELLSAAAAQTAIDSLNEINVIPDTTPIVEVTPLPTVTGSVLEWDMYTVASSDMTENFQSVAAAYANTMGVSVSDGSKTVEFKTNQWVVGNANSNKWRHMAVSLEDSGLDLGHITSISFYTAPGTAGVVSSMSNTHFRFDNLAVTNGHGTSKIMTDCATLSGWSYAGNAASFMLKADVGTPKPCVHVGGTYSALRELTYTPSAPVDAVVTSKNAHTAGKPYAVDLKYDDGTGICVAIYDVVEDFAAPVNTANDSSSAIQQALNAAKKAGGGVVYIPEGVYTCMSAIDIPKGVTLRGEWQSPDDATPASSGTILSVQTDASDSSPFIGLHCGSGLHGVTILYPSTAQGNMTSYSPTIAEVADGGSDSYTVLNTTVLGGSVGYDGATSWSELHYLKNVYLSSMNTGIKINDVTDIGRLEGVHISPEYLIHNAYAPVSASAATAIRDYARANGTGLYIQRSDWQYVYELEINGYNRGIFLDKYNDPNRQAGDPTWRGSNGQMFGLTIGNCNTAIDVTYVNYIGYALTDLNIHDCSVGIFFSNDYISHFEIANLSMTGVVNEPIKMVSQSRVDQYSFRSAKLTVTNSNFACSTGGNYVVNLASGDGNISLQQCTFTQPSKHVNVASTSGTVSVLGCTFPGRPDISRTTGRQNFVKVDPTPLNLPVSTYTHTYRRSIPTATSMYVYNVADYGAVSNTDSTAAFEAALSAARRTGGIVYVPKGEFTISRPLTVPSGVELRGIYGVPTHPQTRGSVLRTDYGRNDESAQAFISLEAGSGINGINFYYPNQSHVDFVPYAWTVRSLGRNCWAINSVFINSYNALDFNTYESDGHYISYVSGSPLRRGIYVGNNSSNGWVENVQFNPHYWKRSYLSASTEDLAAVNQKVSDSLAAIIFGDNASEHVLGTFAFGAKDLLVFNSTRGNGTNGVIIGHGSDGCRNAIVVNQIDRVAMINSQIVSMNATADMHHIVMGANVTGTLALFNTAAWGQPKTAAIQQSGGNLIVSQLFYYNMEDTTYFADVSGGTFYMSSSMVSQDTTTPLRNGEYAASGKARLRLVGNLYASLSPAVYQNRSDAMRVVRSGGNTAVSQSHGWWI